MIDYVYDIGIVFPFFLAGVTCFWVIQDPKLLIFHAGIGRIQSLAGARARAPGTSGQRASASFSTRSWCSGASMCVKRCFNADESKVDS
ncbi:transmembrane protein, putative [Medicago truncatula]|nr:transmembrane protein, putative [Medicago truncatula]